jgi:hypothetical protein
MTIPVVSWEGAVGNLSRQPLSTSKQVNAAVVIRVEGAIGGCESTMSPVTCDVWIDARGSRRSFDQREERGLVQGRDA